VNQKKSETEQQKLRRKQERDDRLKEKMKLELKEWKLNKLVSQEVREPEVVPAVLADKDKEEKKRQVQVFFSRRSSASSGSCRRGSRRSANSTSNRCRRGS